MKNVTEFFKNTVETNTKLWPVVAIRLLVGYMFIKTGSLWLGYDDPTGEMTTAINSSLENDRAFSFYAPFLRNVVLANVGLFTFLVSWGEFLVGISVFSGTITRLGSAGGMFLMLNYILRQASTLENPFTGPPLWFILLAVLMITASGRVFGVDQYLHKKWPNRYMW